MTLPLPQRGQPIDYDYLYQIAQAIHNLEVDTNRRVGTNLIDSVAGQSATSVPTSQTQIIAKKTLISPGKTSASATTPFTVDFDVPFSSIPVVTVTPQKNAVTGTSGLYSAIITSISTTQVKGYLQLGSAGVTSVELQTIAIGFKQL